MSDYHAELLCRIWRQKLPENERIDALCANLRDPEYAGQGMDALVRFYTDNAAGKREQHRADTACLDMRVFFLMQAGMTQLDACQQLCDEGHGGDAEALERRIQRYREK